MTVGQEQNAPIGVPPREVHIVALSLWSQQPNRTAARHHEAQKLLAVYNAIRSNESLWNSTLLSDTLPDVSPVCLTQRSVRHVFAYPPESA